MVGRERQTRMNIGKDIAMNQRIDGLAKYLGGATLALVLVWAAGGNAQPAGNPLGLMLDHVTIGVADMDKEIDWYRRVLGLRPGQMLHTARFDAQNMTAPGVRIDLIRQPGSTRPSPLMGFDKQGWLHVALTTHDAEAVYKRFMEMGVEVEANRDKSGKINIVTLNDPEGNNIEIMQK
jgi:catechol 2,3-dioxygenase-like lactoylglutathione lyase family enzyme